MTNYLEDFVWKLCNDYEPHMDKFYLWANRNGGEWLTGCDREDHIGYMIKYLNYLGYENVEFKISDIKTLYNDLENLIMDYWDDKQG